jgi:hypothetical protein
MSKFNFDPPLTLRGHVVVRSLDDAVRFILAYKDAKQSAKQRRLLYHLEGAIGEAEERDIAYAFREWAEAENLFVK